MLTIKTYASAIARQMEKKDFTADGLCPTIKGYKPFPPMSANTIVDIPTFNAHVTAKACAYALRELQAQYDSVSECQNKIESDEDFKAMSEEERAIILKSLKDSLAAIESDRKFYVKASGVKVACKDMASVNAACVAMSEGVSRLESMIAWVMSGCPKGRKAGKGKNTQYAIRFKGMEDLAQTVRLNVPVLKESATNRQAISEVKTAIKAFLGDINKCATVKDRTLKVKDADVLAVCEFKRVMTNQSIAKDKTVDAYKCVEQIVLHCIANTYGFDMDSVVSRNATAVNLTADDITED